MGSYPMVPGHEIVGTVTALGPEVRHLEAGARVGVGWQRGACLACDSCIAGDENLCAQNVATCVGNYGGFADRVRLDSRFAFPIPEGIASENAAPLLCGGATVYSPLRRWVKPSMRVGVVGIGGLGHLGLQFAAAMGCEVTAISSTPDKEAEARGFGAHHFLATREAKALRSAASSLDFILSTVFATPDWDALLGALRPNGVLCLVGATSEPLVGPGLHPPGRAEDRHRFRDRRPPRDPGDAGLRGPARRRGEDAGAAPRRGGRSARRRSQGPRAVPYRPRRVRHDPRARGRAPWPGGWTRDRLREFPRRPRPWRRTGLPERPRGAGSSAAPSPPVSPSPRGPEPRPRFSRLEVPR